MEGLDTLRQLNTLEVAGNPLSQLTPLHLPELREFWCNDCHIADWSTLSVLQSCSLLETVYLERNPLASTPDYVSRLVSLIPTLVQVDASMIRR
mmetsp:Transcript_74135/g.174074  ORF Transcript_74135/g.174074 Transcript_74135/m.174074 type:complete len:94 (-) Transcript_74135:37-318(-)